MKMPPTHVVRQGQFGLFVVTVIPPSTPHVLLPLDRPPTVGDIAHFWNEDEFTPRPVVGLTREAFEAALLRVGSLAPSRPSPSTPENLRKAAESAAAGSAQPWGWMGSAGPFGQASRVYMSVSGPRWSCCGNRFESAHTPWCSPTIVNDPLPPA